MQQSDKGGRIIFDNEPKEIVAGADTVKIAVCFEFLRFGIWWVSSATRRLSGADLLL